MTVHLSDSDNAHCLNCRRELPISADYEPAYCSDCMKRWESVQRSWGTIVIVGAIVLHYLAVTVGVKFWEWNFPA